MLYRLYRFLALDFLAAAFLVDFLAADFLGDFFADLLAADFLADFLADLAGDLLMVDFLAAGFRAPAFLAGTFFFAARFRPFRLRSSTFSCASAMICLTRSAGVMGSGTASSRFP